MLSTLHAFASGFCAAYCCTSRCGHVQPQALHATPAACLMHAVAEQAGLEQLQAAAQAPAWLMATRASQAKVCLPLVPQIAC